MFEHEGETYRLSAGLKRWLDDRGADAGCLADYFRCLAEMSGDQPGGRGRACAGPGLFALPDLDVPFTPRLIESPIERFQRVRGECLSIHGGSEIEKLEIMLGIFTHGIADAGEAPFRMLSRGEVAAAIAYLKVSHGDALTAPDDERF